MSWTARPEMSNRGDILRVRLLDAPCSGCGRPVTVWLGWGVVVTADRGGERHDCKVDVTSRVRENGSEEASEQAAPVRDILLCGPGTVLVPPAGAALRHEEQAR
jgi:hypothetical protein